MKNLGNKIIEIKKVKLENFLVSLVFDDGQAGEISLEHLFSPPKELTSEILKGQMFDKCFIEMGALAWPNGFELCPDSLKKLFYKQKKHKAA